MAEAVPGRSELAAAEETIQRSPLRGPFYHVVRSSPAADDDFLSQWAKNMRDIESGRRPRRVPNRGNQLHMWAGISAYDGATNAGATARQHRWLGDFIAELLVPVGAAIRIEKTGEDAHHFTLWGAPSDLRPCVQSIRRV